MKGDLSIKFFPHPTKVKDGKHQLYCRSIGNRQKVEISTRFFVPFEKWEVFIQKNSTIDEEITRLKKEIYRVGSGKKGGDSCTIEVEAKR